MPEFPRDRPGGRGGKGIAGRDKLSVEEEGGLDGADGGPENEEGEEDVGAALVNDAHLGEGGDGDDEEGGQQKEDGGEAAPPDAKKDGEDGEDDGVDEHGGEEEKADKTLEGGDEEEAVGRFADDFLRVVEGFDP